VLCVSVADYSKLTEQEAREKASTDQLANTDVRTKEFENMVHLYKYVVYRCCIIFAKISLILSLNCKNERTLVVHESQPNLSA